ncbi:hypothetical protein SETIT_9G121800v2 [Setaria italica]|uniref:Cytochrome c oxidase subunit n=1 Tax=Setaria italica TaxID=4555 RepID=A0A368SHH2_SETIT|nr:hypothetical protein SETIT_9G121800v2 [Setaria italica]
MSSSPLSAHENTRGRDMAAVARGEPVPRPPHEPGSLRTAPTDFCFPTQNQTRHCYVRYPEYHRCVKAKDGDDRTECDKFQRYYGSLCPTDWVVEWNRQREEGIFPGPI